MLVLVELCLRHRSNRLNRDDPSGRRGTPQLLERSNCRILQGSSLHLPLGPELEQSSCLQRRDPKYHRRLVPQVLVLVLANPSLVDRSNRQNLPVPSSHAQSSHQNFQDSRDRLVL